MDGIDWGEWIRADRDNINRDRGGAPAGDTLEEREMEITETELNEMADMPWSELSHVQQRMVLTHLTGPGKSKSRSALREVLDANPTRSAMEIWRIQQAASAGASVDVTYGHKTDTVTDNVTDMSTTAGVPARWEPGMLVGELPEDLHRARVVISDAQKTASAAREHPGQWVVYSVHTGQHARRVALDKCRRVAGGRVQAFTPAGVFTARAIEVEPGKYVVFARTRDGAR